MAACATVDQRGALLTRKILVTVHDLYGGPRPMWPLQWYLKLRRDHDIDPFQYDPRTQDLSTSGKALGEFLRRQKPHTTDESINFVTHGYGALVLREAFRYIDWNYTKSKVVMLAPPNRGIRYHRSMKKHVGVAGYGGAAAEELATWTADDLDERLGKLPKRCYPLVLAGSLCLNPFAQSFYPNDGMVMVEETTLPGEFRHRVIGATHYSLPSHPLTIHLTRTFLEA